MQQSVRQLIPAIKLSFPEGNDALLPSAQAMGVERTQDYVTDRPFFPGNWPIDQAPRQHSATDPTIRYDRHQPTSGYLARA